MATNVIHPSIVVKGIQGAFQESYEQAEIVRDQLAITVPSTGRRENYAFLGGPRGVEQWIGDRRAVDLPDYSFYLDNKKWEDNIRIKEDDLADDQVGQYPIQARTMGQQAAEHPDDLLFSLINNGHSATYVSYDGAIFFSASHVAGENTSQDNTLTYTVAHANTNEPTVLEMQAMVDQGIQKLSVLKNWAGKYFNKQVNKLIVVVPPSLKSKFLNAFGAGYTSNLAGTGVSENIWKTNYNVKIVSDSRVDESATSTTSRYVFVFNAGHPIKPFVYQIRQPFRPQTDNVDQFKRGEISWGVDARYNVGYGAWWTGCRITVAT